MSIFASTITLASDLCPPLNDPFLSNLTRWEVVSYVTLHGLDLSTPEIHGLEVKSYRSSSMLWFVHIIGGQGLVLEI